MSRNKSNEAALKKRADLEVELARTKQASHTFPPFKFELDGYLGIEKGESVVTLHSYFHYFQDVMEMMAPGKTELSAKLFKDDHTVEEFAGKVHLIFTHWLSKVLAEEATLYLNDVIHFVLSDMALDEVDLNAQARIHAKQTATLVRQRLGLRKNGQRSLWSRFELARAVFDAMGAIPNHPDRTYEGVVEELKKRHPDKAPESADALRKMLKRMGLSWKRIKADRKKMG